MIAAAIEVATVPTLEGIDVRDWDRLVGVEGFYTSYGWLRSLELTHGPLTSLVATEGGRLVGALPTWMGESPDSKMFSVPSLVGTLPGRWDRPFLWLGGRRATANAPVWRRGAREASIMQYLLHAARQYAARQGLWGVVWPYLPAAVALRIATSYPCASVLLHSADAIVDVPAGGFRAMAARSRRRDRTKWLRELHAFEHSGGELEWSQLSSETMAPIAALVADNRSRHGSRGGEEWMQRTLSAQEQAGIARGAIVATTKRHGRLVATAVFYEWRGHLYGRYWGAAPDAPRFSYYVLTQYAGIDWCAEHAVRQFHLSISSWEAKVHRGATLHPLAAVIVPAEGADELVGAPKLRRHNAFVARSWKNLFPSRPEAFHPTWQAWEEADATLPDLTRPTRLPLS
ncbi:MAG: GNAT family N-acetyltransferase [Gammaproteobacteria bacterium]|nr:GNAT family N-acetyltransferase [Gammaproteobacteria bacterium]